MGDEDEARKVAYPAPSKPQAKDSVSRSAYQTVVKDLHKARTENYHLRAERDAYQCIAEKQLMDGQLMPQAHFLMRKIARQAEMLKTLQAKVEKLGEREKLMNSRKMTAFLRNLLP